MNTKLLENFNIKTCCTGRRLSSLLQIKDNTKKEHEHYTFYHVNCPEESYEDSYIGVSGRLLVERAIIAAEIINVLKHSKEKRHTELEYNEFKMIRQNYNNS